MNEKGRYKLERLECMYFEREIETRSATKLAVENEKVLHGLEYVFSLSYPA